MSSERARSRRDRSLPWSLARRLSLALALLTMTFLLLSFAAVFLLVRRDETRDLDAALLAEARRELTQGTPLGDRSATVPESLSPTPRFVATYDQGGRLLATSANLALEPPDLDRLGIDLDGVSDEGQPVNLEVRGADLRGVVLRLSDGRFLLFAVSRRVVADDERFLVRLLTVLFVVATGASALVARVVGARLARDVDTIADVARRVSEGDLKARVGGGVGASRETRSLARALDRMIDELAALVGTQQDFVASAAHELRSPLVTLRGELQFALRRPRTTEEYRAAIEAVLEDVEVLTRMAEELLSLAKAQREGDRPREVRGARVLADEAARLSRGAARLRGVQIVVEGEDVPLLVVPGDVTRALRNLLDNAVAHSPEGGVVTVTCGAEGSQGVLSVADRGPGVAREMAEAIFVPFSRGAAERADGGAGLGLALAREVARRHGGDVKLDTTHAPGARFLLSLPRAP